MIFKIPVHQRNIELIVLLLSYQCWPATATGSTTLTTRTGSISLEMLQVQKPCLIKVTQSLQ